MSEQEQYQEPMYIPGGSQMSDKADLLERIRPDEIVDIMRQRLLGKEFVNGKWVVMPHLKSSALSEKGAWEIANLMLPASSQNVSISNLKDKDIRQRVISLVRTAMIMCLRNWEEYGIKGTDQIFFVRELVHTNTLVTMKQPESEGIRKLLKGTTSEVRSVSDSEPARKGLMGRFVSRR